MENFASSVTMTIQDGPSPQAVDLIAGSGLVTADITHHPRSRYIEVRSPDGTVVGIGGLEIHAGGGLVRSVAVDDRHRSFGLGTSILIALVAHAAEAGLQDIFLLTEDAAGFFARHGFQPMAREDVPEWVQATPQYAELCADSAVIMHRPL